MNFLGTHSPVIKNTCLSDSLLFRVSVRRTGVLISRGIHSPEFSGDLYDFPGNLRRK